MNGAALRDGRRRAWARPLAASLIWATVAVGLAAPPRLQGELRILSGIQAVSDPAGTVATVPLALQARLDLGWQLDRRLEVRAAATPTVAVGMPGGASDRPHFAPGIEELYLRLPSAALELDLDVDLDLGVVRWPVGELRLGRPLRLDGRDRLGTPRGLLGARATAFAHPWRVRVAAASPLDDDLRPSGLGGLAAARVEVSRWTLEAYGFALARSGVGLAGSGTVGRQVVYAEAWLLTGPWEGRGGVGLSGYRGAWLWSGEAAWGPGEGTLEPTLARSSRPSLRLSSGRPVGGDGSLDVVAGVAWPASPTEPERTVAAYDLSATLTLDRPEAVLTLRPWWQQSERTTAFGANVTVRTFF